MVADAKGNLSRRAHKFLKDNNTIDTNIPGDQLVEIIGFGFTRLKNSADRDVFLKMTSTDVKHVIVDIASSSGRLSQDQAVKLRKWIGALSRGGYAPLKENSSKYMVALERTIKETFPTIKEMAIDKKTSNNDETSKKDDVYVEFIKAPGTRRKNLSKYDQTVMDIASLYGVEVIHQRSSHQVRAVPGEIVVRKEDALTKKDYQALKARLQRQQRGRIADNARLLLDELSEKRLQN